MSNWILTGPIVGCVLIAAGLVLGYLVFPPIVHQKIIESVELHKDTEQYERWKVTPQPLDFKVYIFNVTNPEEIQRGAQPKVEEIGPYVYNQYRRKYNIRFSRDNERLSYYQQMNFVFNAEKSYPLREDDKLVVLSMHMNSVLQMLEMTSRRMITNVTRGVERTIDRIPVINVVKRMLDRYTPLKSIIQTIEQDTPYILALISGELQNIFGPQASSMFVETTARNFLFDGIEFCRDPIGIAQIVCMSIEERKSPTIIKTDDGRALRFSMFNHKNKTHDGLYEINTGIRRLENLMKIEKWNHIKTLKSWKTDRNGAPSVCQFINGTDGSAVAPFRKEGDNFYIFSSDICRSVQLFYERKTSYAGIPGYRYQTRDNFLNQIGAPYGNDCFCVNKINGSLRNDDGCLYSGAIDLSECLEAPIVGSAPHFYGADPVYNLMIDGTYPNPDKHQIFLEVEPKTGSPLRGGKKMQFNMFLRKIDQITITNSFKTPVLFPVLWVDEGIELNDDMVGLIKKDLINVLLILDIVQWCLISTGAVLIICMLVWYYIARKKMLKTSSTEIITEQSGSSELKQ